MPDLSLFHFIRPWALLLIIPAALLFWLYRRISQQRQGWAAIIDPHLLEWIMPRSDAGKARKHLPFLLLAFWIIACLALAGPTWKKTPQPVFSSKATQVILLDMSYSMDADDIKPSRLERAKYKIKDYLKLHNEGLTGLVVYAGDGFILSPLTSDKDTIENLLGALSTNIMPLLGSRPELGFEKAIDLLDSTGLAQGKILWFTDGAEEENLEAITEQLEGTPYQVTVLALGTEEGAPIKLSNEKGFLKDRNGNVVIPQLDYSKLEAFARENDALLTPVTADNSDVQLMVEATSTNTDSEQQENKFADDWFDLGYWLIILLLPLALLSFKHRALLGCLCLFTFMGLTTPTAQANPLEKLFLNDNQQAKKLLDKDNLEEAYSKFKDPRWKAQAAYRMGSYDAAERLLKQLPEDALQADDWYNKGNALALQGEYEQAIEAYEQALAQDPDHQDAEYNKGVVEQAKQQQEQQQEQQNQNQDGDAEQNDQQQDSEQQQSDQENDQESDQDSEQQQQDSEQQQRQQQEQQKPELTEEQLKEQFKEEEKDQEMEQWLRRLPDDPGGLLRRKMYREYQRRGRNQHVEKNW